MLKKNKQGNDFHPTKHFTLQNRKGKEKKIAEELFCYLGHKDKMETKGMSLKLDIKYFLIKFSLTLEGYFYNEFLCVEPAREMLWIDQEKILPLFWCFIIIPV